MTWIKLNENELGFIHEVLGSQQWGGCSISKHVRRKIEKKGVYR